MLKIDYKPFQPERHRLDGGEDDFTESVVARARITDVDGDSATYEIFIDGTLFAEAHHIAVGVPIDKFTDVIVFLDEQYRAYLNFVATR